MKEIMKVDQRPPGTIEGHEIGVWWRLTYLDGRCVTEDFNQSSICFAPKGARSLQLVSSILEPEGSGLIEVPLGLGERPVFYRIRSMTMNQDVIGSNCEGVIYGKGVDVGNKLGTTLWCMIPGQPGLSNPVPNNWVDKSMLELQVAHYG